MKNAILVLISIFLFNCTSDDSKPKENETILFGKWKIIEQLMDPGDGSGVFQSITSDRTVEFFSNGTVTANGVLCYITTEVGTNSIGTFINTSDNDFSDGEITPSDCSFDGLKVYYKIEGSNLILWYQCIEGCGQKFEKIIP